jgi:hypothetical protein
VRGTLSSHDIGKDQKLSESRDPGKRVWYAPQRVVRFCSVSSFDFARFFRGRPQDSTSFRIANQGHGT